MAMTVILQDRDRNQVYSRIIKDTDEYPNVITFMGKIYAIRRVLPGKTEAVYTEADALALAEPEISDG